MVNPSPSCPLCRLAGAEIERVPNRDMRRVACRRCGTYRISGSAEAYVRSDQFTGKRFKLITVLRRASERGTVLDVLSRDADDLADQASPRRDLPQLLDDLLLVVYDRVRVSDRVDSWVLVSEYDNVLLALHQPADLFYILEQLEKLGYVERQFPHVISGGINSRLTVEGWRRAEQIRRVGGDSSQAFVAMWFNPELTPVLRDGIEPALRATGYDPKRIDAIFHGDGVDDRILAEIRKSGLVVADFTGQRHGVYFEAGFAMALGVPVIWCCRADEVDNLHFDTRQYPHLLWNTPEDLRDALIAHVRGRGLARLAGHKGNEACLPRLDAERRSGLRGEQIAEDA